MSLVKIKRALISVSDKTNLEKLVQTLKSLDVEIISTGGTAKRLLELGINYTPIEKITSNPEAFGGRMKTISFQVASALLFRRDNEDDVIQARELNITPIDLVVCNLYPFLKVVKAKGPLDELIENIDIGGPTMVRASAKNYKHVTICTNIHSYEDLITELQTNNGQTTLEFRTQLALKAFEHTASYDTMVSSELGRQFNHKTPTIGLFPEFSRTLRYGENPHQEGYVFEDPLNTSLAGIIPLQGKALSYNNLLDADAALRTNIDLQKLIEQKNLENKNSVVIIKHANPCGAAIASTSVEALELAWNGDKISSFGSIISFSHEVDEASAKWLSDKFVEVILAPQFSKGAMELFSKKKNLRCLELGANQVSSPFSARSILGGWIVQEEDQGLDDDFKSVTKKVFPNEKMSLAHFGVMLCKHLKSNAIAYVKEDNGNYFISGAGMGNPNRLISLNQAVEKAKENGEVDFGNGLLISDAFFPFRDNIDLANGFGIKHFVQPGGSIKDNEVIGACDEFGLSMIFTGKRHFRH